MKFLALVALAALTTLAFACGDDDDDTQLTGTPDNGATTEVTVDIVNFIFEPDSITIPAGEEVVFAVSNADLAPHTFTVYNDAEYTDPQGLDVSAAAGGSGEGSGTFTVGEYFFRCDIHPAQMQGSFTAE